MQASAVTMLLGNTLYIVRKPFTTGPWGTCISGMSSIWSCGSCPFKMWWCKLRMFCCAFVVTISMSSLVCLCYHGHVRLCPLFMSPGVLVSDWLGSLLVFEPPLTMVSGQVGDLLRSALRHLLFSTLDSGAFLQGDLELPDTTFTLVGAMWSIIFVLWHWSWLQAHWLRCRREPVWRKTSVWIVHWCL